MKMHYNIEILGGAHLSYPEHDEVSRYLLEGWYEYQEQSFVYQFLQSGDVFFDIGAHAGLYSAIADKAVGPDGAVVALEPNRQILPYLEKNIGVPICAEIAWGAERRSVLPIAAGDMRRKAFLRLAEEHKSAYANIIIEGDAGATDAEIDVYSLDAIVERLAPGRVDLIKIDVEGAEHLLLQGAGATLRQFEDVVLLMEFTENNQQNFSMSTADLLRQVEELGFRPARIDMDTLELAPVRDTGPFWHENFVLARDLDKVAGKLRNSNQAVRRKVELALARGRACSMRYQESEAFRVLRAGLDRVIESELPSLLTALTRQAPPAVEFSALDAAGDSVALARELTALLEDGLGRIGGAGRALAETLDAERAEGHRQARAIETLTEKIRLPLDDAVKYDGFDDGSASDASAPLQGSAAELQAVLKKTGPVPEAIKELAEEIHRVRGDLQYARMAKEDIAEIGDALMKLQRSRLIEIASALNLKSAALVDKMINVYTAKGK